MFSCVRDGRSELIIKRSRFISVCGMAESRDAVLGRIESLRAEYPDATHICYGYIADERGDLFGYDDDGEPSGTAGKPIYSALAASGAKRSFVAVVRYFGGIKLGAGGLTRAYRECAAAVIDEVGLASVEKCTVYRVECDSDTYKKATGILRNAACSTDGIVYNKNVSFGVTAPQSVDVAELLKPLGVAIEQTGEKYVYCDKQ